MRTTFTDLLTSKYLTALVKESEAGETAGAPDLANGMLSEMLAQRSSLPEALWDGNRLRPEVRRHLLDIAAKFHESLGVRAEPVDIRLTGSMANYNWTSKSDIDLHPVYNLKEIDDDLELVQELLQAKRAVWNDAHTPVVRKHEVEVYPQDATEPHHATGVYSLLEDAWVKEPPRSRSKVDRQSVAAKADGLMHEIDSAKDCEDCLARLERLKAKIAKMRQCGLERGGEYSVENLAFKVLRNNGYLEKLSEAIRRERDATLSLKNEGGGEVDKGGSSEGAKRGWETRRGRAAVEETPGEGREPAEETPEGAGPASKAEQQIAAYRQAAAERVDQHGGAEAIRDATKTEVVGEDWQKYQDSLGRRDDLMLDFVRDHAGKGASDEAHTLYNSWALDIHNRAALTWRSAAAADLGRTADDEWFDDQLDRSLGLRKRMAMGADEMTQEAARASKAWSEEVWKAWNGDKPKTVYRGVELDSESLEALSMGGSVDFGVNALSSWTTDPNTAQEFGNVIVTMEASPEDVWGYHRAHTLLDDDEAEVILGHSTPKMRLTEIAGDEGQFTVRAEPASVAKDLGGAERHLDSGDNGNWLHEVVRGPRRGTTPAEKAQMIVSAILKGGSAEGAKRGWETRRGRSAVEETPADKKPGAEDELGDPKSGKIALDWLTAAASPGEEPDAASAKKIALDWLQESAPSEADAEAAEDLVEDAAEVAVSEEKPPAEERTKIALDWLQSVGQEPTPEAVTGAEEAVAEVLDEAGVEGHDEAKEPEVEEAPAAEPEAPAEEAPVEPVAESASEEQVQLVTENLEHLSNNSKRAQGVMEAWEKLGFGDLDAAQETFAEMQEAQNQAAQALETGDLSAADAAKLAEDVMEADIHAEGMIAAYQANIDEKISEVETEKAKFDAMKKVSDAAKLAQNFKYGIDNKVTASKYLLDRLGSIRDPGTVSASSAGAVNVVANRLKNMKEGPSWNPQSWAEQAYDSLRLGLEKKYGPKVQEQLGLAQKALQDPKVDKKVAAAQHESQKAGAALLEMFHDPSKVDEMVAKSLAAKKATSAAKSAVTKSKKSKGLLPPSPKKLPKVELTPVKVSDKKIAEQLEAYRGQAKEYSQKKFGGDPAQIKAATTEQGARSKYMTEFVTQALKGYGAPAPGMAPLDPVKGAERVTSAYSSWGGSANGFDALNWRGAALQAYNRSASDENIGKAKADGDNKKTLEGGSPYAHASMVASKPWAEEVWKAWKGDKPTMVYRGVKGLPNMGGIRDALNTTGEADLTINSLSSWSEKKGMASSWAGAGNIVIHQRITPDRVWGYYKAHKLYGEGEAEVVVGHPSPKIRVRLLEAKGIGKNKTYHVEVIDVGAESEEKALTPSGARPIISADYGDNADWLHEAVLGHQTPMDDPHPEDPSPEDLDDEVTPWEEWDEDNIEDEE